MKKIYTLLLSVFFGLSAVHSQNISFTIKPGADATSAKVFFTSNADLTGVVSQILVTFTLPSSVAAVAPSASFVTNAAFPQWTTLSLNPPTTETVDGVSSYVYTFFAAPVTAVTTSLTSGAEVMLGEVTFAPGTNITDLKLASLPNGGGSSISYLVLEIGGVVLSNSTSLTYGPGAVNSPSGFEGLSYVPLAGTLPVKFLSFYALKSGDAAKLTWTVTNDADNKYFEVERSTDGKNYTLLARVDALANGKTNNTYEAADRALSNVGSKDIYYRIKQVDKSGGITYSVIRILNVGRNIALSLYPNPARSITKLVLDAPAAGKAAVIVRDAAGKQVQLINLNLVQGINQKDINVSSLPAGDYNVSVITESLNQTIKLTKLN